MRRSFPWPEAFMLVAVAGVFIFIVSLLPSPNYAGTGNDFEITATITKVTDQSVFVDNVSIISAEGEASDWFTTDGGWFGADHREIHNNYSGGDFWSSEHDIGEVVNANGYSMDIHLLQTGDHIRVRGKIRASKSGKSSPYRAVFDRLQLMAA